MTTPEVAIVGAGPIGLELAISLKHLGVPYLHFDAGQIGQTITGYPHHARFFSSPERIALANVPLANAEQAKASREEYLTYLRAIAEQFDLPVHTFHRVERIRPTDSGFEIHTSHRGQRATHHTKRVVLAVGDMHRPRRLNVEGEDLDHVSHYFVDPHRYFRQRLLIVGGRNSAAEAALRCHRAGARVTISYRRPEFDETSIKYWLLPELKSLIKHGKIGFHPCTCVQRIGPTDVRLIPSAHADCTPHEDPAPANVPADFVLLLTGYEMDPSLFENAGVELVGDNRSPGHDADTMETNVPGLYVAGTAAAGTQYRFKLFIENCHPHVIKIVQHITGQAPPAHLVNAAARDFSLPES